MSRIRPRMLNQAHFYFHDVLAVDLYATQILRRERANEHLIVPMREFVAGINAIALGEIEGALVSPDPACLAVKFRC